MPVTDDGIFYDKDELFGRVEVIFDATMRGIPVGYSLALMVISGEAVIVGSEILIW